MQNAPHYYAKDRDAWLTWLQQNYNKQKAVWLVFDKGNKSFGYDDIVEVALCYGWIDSRPGKVSDTQTKLYICQRKPKSVWSKINKARIEKLLQQNLMHPAGMAAIEIAKANGSWDALNNSDNLIIPPEMAQLFAVNKKAAENYNNFSNSSKKVILEWIYAAKQQETKLSRITTTVELAEKGIKAR